MPSSLSFDKAPISHIKRLKYFPRIGVTVDFAGYQLSWRSVPLAETLANLTFRGPEASSLGKFVETAKGQLREVRMNGFAIEDLEESSGSASE